MTDPESTQEGEVFDPADGGRPQWSSGPPSHRRPASARRLVLVVVAVVVLLVIGVGAWYEIEANPFGGQGPAVTVIVARGNSASAVIDTLARDGVIASSLAFKLGDVIHGTPLIRAGGYRFHKNQSFSTVRAILSAGPTIFAVRVPPGLTLAEVAQRVDTVPGHNAVAFVSTANSGVVRSVFQPVGSNNLEGLLGTGTYLVRPGESDAQLLNQMVVRFNTQAASAGLTPAAAAILGMTPYQVITIGSIVEKEGYIQKNMAHVSRVIYNRLAKGTPLQMDSTVLYSIGQDGGPVTRADLALKTPYNTYLHTGLPPTPICIPSVSALAAATSPPPGPWLFFTVVEKDGTEAFAVTFAQQLANEKLAQSRGLG